MGSFGAKVSLRDTIYGILYKGFKAPPRSFKGLLWGFRVSGLRFL